MGTAAPSGQAGSVDWTERTPRARRPGCASDPLRDAPPDAGKGNEATRRRRFVERGGERVGGPAGGAVSEAAGGKGRAGLSRQRGHALRLGGKARGGKPTLRFTRLLVVLGSEPDLAGPPAKQRSAWKRIGANVEDGAGSRQDLPSLDSDAKGKRDPVREEVRDAPEEGAGVPFELLGQAE